MTCGEIASVADIFISQKVPGLLELIIKYDN